MKPWKTIGGALLFLIVAYLAWQLQSTAKPAAPVPTGNGYFEWTAPSLRQALRNKQFTLVNVHLPFEGRIPETDLEIPYDQIDQAVGELPQAKDAMIVLYCRSGRMSEIAARKLAELGYSNVVHLRGGMLDWDQAGYPLQTK